MNVPSQTIVVSIENKSSSLLIILALIIRIVIVGVINSLNFPIPYDIQTLIDTIIYLLILSLLVINRDNLPRNNMDRLSVILIISSAFIRLFYSKTLISALIIIASILTSFFVLNKFNIPIRNLTINIRRSTKWSLLGLTRVLVVFVMEVSIFESLSSFVSHNIILNFMNNVLYNFGAASGLEEPIFRGFIFGKLRAFGIGEKNIICIQAFLFWAAHLYLFPRLISLFIMLPLIGLFWVY